jgi:predicted GNAT family acetyltransferase
MSQRGESVRRSERVRPAAYLFGRDPKMRISTSRFALCCQSGLVATGYRSPPVQQFTVVPDPADDIDEALEETFPASDPPANTVETGIGGGRDEGAVVDNPARQRFELTLGDQTAFLQYERTPDRFSILHTEVPPVFRGRNLGGRLVEAAVASARAAGLQLIVSCPFARVYLHKHPR